MKKKDIIKIIEANKTINKYKDLLSTLEENRNFYIYKIPEKDWFPDISELKEEFNTLKKELLAAKNETLEAKNTIESLKCTHDVRLNYHNFLFSTNKCVLCGENVESDNFVSFRKSSYRNKHTVTFDAKYQKDDDGPYTVKGGKTNEEVLKIIEKILTKYNDCDEIDLVDEFKKLNLKNCEINTEKRKEEKYILIIGGTNLEYADKEEKVYLTRALKLNSLDFLKYFTSLLDTKVALIDRKETIERKEYKEIDKDHNRIFIQDYTTLEYLETTLNQVEDINFKLIIDLSNIYDYKISGNKVSYQEHDLELDKRFPNSHIVKINDLKVDNFGDIRNLKKIKKQLLSYKRANQLTVINNSDSYYYIDGELKEKNQEGVCNYIKKLLR